MPTETTTTKLIVNTAMMTALVTNIAYGNTGYLKEYTYTQSEYQSFHELGTTSISNETSALKDAIRSRIERDGYTISEIKEDIDDGDTYLLFLLDGEDENFNPVKYSIDLLNDLEKNGVIIPDNLFVEIA